MNMNIKKEIKLLITKEGTTLTAVASKLYGNKEKRKARAQRRASYRSRRHTDTCVYECRNKRSHKGRNFERGSA